MPTLTSLPGLTGLPSAAGRPVTAPGLTTALAAAGHERRPLETPFEHLALAFSGGGFRAASFSLGVLSYLNQVRFPDPGPTADSSSIDPSSTPASSLLNKIHYISSASGGTITSASFALACAEEKTFDDFFNTLRNNLQGQILLTEALEILNSKRRWQDRPDKSRNLINAFALSYDKILFNGKTLTQLRQKGSSTQGMQVPLDEVCFNSTEFFRGQSFRQNIKIAADGLADPWFRYGNYYFYLDPSAAAKIRISDALASSSCFPAGFEPLNFPKDYTYVGLSTDDLSDALKTNDDALDSNDCNTLKEKGFGLMDGGITDNQGLESLMLADNRRYDRQTEFSPFDLILVCDVGSQYMDPYTVPSANRKGALGRLNFTALQWIFLALLPVVIGLLGYFGYKYLPTCPFTSGICFATAGLLLGLTIIFFWLNSKVPDEQTKMGPLNNFAPKIISLLRNYFVNTRLAILYQMLSARVSSTIILNTDVFLKRIRQLIYDAFYQSPRWFNRGKSCHIYDLSYTNDKNRLLHHRNTAPDLNKAVQDVAQRAFKIPTTLWFSENEGTALKDIIACGQFTCCYNLLDYTERLLQDHGLMNTLAPYYIKRLKDIQAVLIVDWEKFKLDPFWLYK